MNTPDQNPPLDSAKLYDDLMSIFDYDDKLAKMTPKELVLEVLGSRAADYRCVNELMNRVLPNFTEVITDEETEAATTPSPERSEPLSLSEKCDALGADKNLILSERSSDAVVLQAYRTELAKVKAERDEANVQLAATNLVLQELKEMSVQEIWKGINKQQNELVTQLRDQKKALASIVERFDEETYVPEPNCACHITPPCNDCVENAGMRELKADAKTLLKACK